jgi:hypothetical protein
MPGDTQQLQSHGIVYVRRPSPALVREIGRRLSATVDEVRYPALVAAIGVRRGARGRRLIGRCVTSWRGSRRLTETSCWQPPRAVLQLI